jgi:flavin-dependent dehydrogenase
MYDVIVVGARIAGSTTAFLAAKAGLKVLLIDRHRFPSDTISTSYIHQSGCIRLKKWGMLNKIAASGCPAITSTMMQIDDVSISGAISHDQVQVEAYAPRRIVLDKLLIESAQEENVEFRDRCTFKEALFENNRCVGVRIKNESQQFEDLRAKLVVGADGMRSSVAKKVGAKYLSSKPALTGVYYGFWDIERNYELYESGGNWVGVMPSNKSLIVAVYYTSEEFSRIKGNALQEYLSVLARVTPDLREKMTTSSQIGKLWGTGDQRNFFRKAFGPGWALVGDAAHHKDSITALGITDGIAQAELLANAISNQIDSPSALDASLKVYQQTLLKTMYPGYKETLDLADATKKDQRKALLHTLSQSDSATSMYLDAVAGLRPYSDLDSLFPNASLG